MLRLKGRVAIHGCDWGTVLWRSSDPARMGRMLEVRDGHVQHPHLPQTLQTSLRSAGFGQGDHAVHVMFNPVYTEST